MIENPAQSPAPIRADSIRFLSDSLVVYTGAVRFILKKCAEEELCVLMKDGENNLTFSVFQDRPISQLSRPQTPEKTTAYEAREVVFASREESIKLSGTLTTPKTPPSSMAILLTGSGPQDRDETIFGHKPFAILAHELTLAGMGILRFDDRGVAASEGNYNSATSYDFAHDAAGAYKILKDEFPEMDIGFIGHSEGAMIAQIADSIVGGASFHIYLGGPGKKITELMQEQNKLVLKDLVSPEGLETYINSLPSIYATITSDSTLEVKQAQLNELTKTVYNKLPEDDARRLAPSQLIYSMSYGQLLYLRWWPYFLSYNPEQYLKQIDCPILALYGERDIQVPPSNGTEIQKAAVQSRVSFEVLEQTNHLFQRCQTCSVSEYGMLTESFSPLAITAIVDWLSENEFVEN